MRVAVVQTDPEFGKKKGNIEAALALMATTHSDLYVLPELFATGYDFIDRREAEELAEDLACGYTFPRMLRFASRRQCYVVYGFAESDGNRIYNSAVLVGYDGTIGLYRKVHLFDREKLFFNPGNLGFPVFEIAFGRIGLMICFDWYFPESARTLALKGAQLIAHPANLVLPHCPEGMRTRCLENRVFAVTANRIGTEDRTGHSLSFIGKSQITSCMGEVIHRSSADQTEVEVREIDLTAADNKLLNARNHLFNDRRPEVYFWSSAAKPKQIAFAVLTRDRS